MAIVFFQVSGTLIQVCCLKKTDSAPLGCGHARWWPCRTEGRSPQSEGGDGGLRPGKEPSGGWREKVLWPQVWCCISHPQGRAWEPSTPLQAPTHPWRKRRWGLLSALDPVPGVLGAAKPFAHLHHRDSMTTENGSKINSRYALLRQAPPNRRRVLPKLVGSITKAAIISDFQEEPPETG